MSRRRRSRLDSRGRDAAAIARPRLLRDPLAAWLGVWTPHRAPVDPWDDSIRESSQLPEDRRLWYPSAYQPAKTVLGARAALTVYPPSRTSSKVERRYRPSSPGGIVPTRVAFVEPMRVTICVRRQRRKEVLHAFKKAGRKPGSFQPRRLTEYSDVSCRR